MVRCGMCSGLSNRLRPTLLLSFSLSLLVRAGYSCTFELFLNHNTTTNNKKVKSKFNKYSVSASRYS